MISTDAQYDKAAAKARSIASKAGKKTPMQFDSETQLTNTLVIYFDGIEACIGVAVEMKGNKIVGSWTY